MPGDRYALGKDPEELERLVRMMGASVNVAILRELARARRKGAGWMYLTQIADALGEAPGTVSAGVQKLFPLVEEKREKGLRYFRATLVDVKVELERPRP